MSASVTTETSYSVKFDKKKGDKVGIVIKSDDGSVSIASIKPESIASGSILKVGDIIISINGKSVNGMSSKDTAELLRKSKGSVEIVAEDQAVLEALADAEADAELDADDNTSVAVEEEAEVVNPKDKDAKNYLTATSSVDVIKDFGFVKDLLWALDKCSLWNKNVKAVEILQEGSTGKFGIGAARKCVLYQGNPVIEDVIKATADEIRLVVRPESLTGAYDHIEKIIKVEKVIQDVTKVQVTIKYSMKFMALAKFAYEGTAQKEMGDLAYSCVYGVKYYAEKGEEVTKETKLYEPISFGTLNE
jgi:membrane-associated protease RseP (regulator of RpoE activity)